MSDAAALPPVRDQEEDTEDVEGSDAFRAEESDRRRPPAEEEEDNHMPELMSGEEEAARKEECDQQREPPKSEEDHPILDKELPSTVEEGKGGVDREDARRQDGGRHGDDAEDPSDAPPRPIESPVGSRSDGSGSRSGSCSGSGSRSRSRSGSGSGSEGVDGSFGGRYDDGDVRRDNRDGEYRDDRRNSYAPRGYDDYDKDYPDDDDDGYHGGDDDGGARRYYYEDEGGDRDDDRLDSRRDPGGGRGGPGGGEIVPRRPQPLADHRADTYYGDSHDDNLGDPNYVLPQFAKRPAAARNRAARGRAAMDELRTRSPPPPTRPASSKPRPTPPSSKPPSNTKPPPQPSLQPQQPSSNTPPQPSLQPASQLPQRQGQVNPQPSWHQQGQPPPPAGPGNKSKASSALSDVPHDLMHKLGDFLSNAFDDDEEKSGSYFSSEFIWQLSSNGGKGDPNVKGVWLQAKSLTASHIKLLSEGLVANQYVVEVWLPDNSIGDEGVASLAYALKFNKRVRELFLGNNGIGPKGAAALAAMLATNKTLVTLGLGGNRIGEEGISALAAALRHNHTLSTLDVKGNGVPMKSEVRSILVKLLDCNSHEPGKEDLVAGLQDELGGRAQALVKEGNEGGAEALMNTAEAALRAAASCRKRGDAIGAAEAEGRFLRICTGGGIGGDDTNGDAIAEKDAGGGGKAVGLPKKGRGGASTGDRRGSASSVVGSGNVGSPGPVRKTKELTDYEEMIQW